MSMLTKLISGVVITAGAVSTALSDNEISVSDVTVTQDSGTRLVTVSYKLTGQPAIVTVDFLTNGVSIGEGNFSNVAGDVNQLVTETEGERKITWQPLKSWPGYISSDFTAKVTAWLPEEPPDYLVVSLGDESALDRAYYVSTNALPHGGLTNDIYRTSRLVMRRIHAAGVRWQMGATKADYTQASLSGSPAARETAHHVILSYDYFMGIYPVTQEQYRRFTGESSLDGSYTAYADSAIRPRCGINYNSLRGSGTGTKHSSFTSGSAIGKLRAFTDIDFDLPSDAEWEYACKAGTTWLVYTGKKYTAANIYEIAWIYGNSMYSDPAINARQTHAVGRKLPNAWGLYDMIGNTLEWCRDKYVANLGTNEVVNPVTASGSGRVMRGYRFDRTHADNATTTTYRQSYADNLGSGNNTCGFRVMCPVTLKFDITEN